MHEFDDKVRKPSRKSQRRHHHRKRISRIIGIRQIVISKLLQKMLGCVVGEDVSSENTWKYVKRNLILENLELHEESSEFLPIRNEILQFLNEDIYVGYIANEESEEDHFYICVTEEAERSVKSLNFLKQKEIENLLKGAINKKALYWKSFGTEEEIEENMAQNNRALLEIDVEANFPVEFANPPNFHLLQVEKIRDGYMEMSPLPEMILNFIGKSRIDLAIQGVPQTTSTETQTICKYPSNLATQYQYLYDVEEGLDVKCQQYLANRDLEHFSNIFDVNANINFYINDFEVIKNVTNLGYPQSEHVNHLSFIDVTRCKGKMVASIDWHLGWSDLVAVAYINQSPAIYYKENCTNDKVNETIFGTHPVLIWSTNDNLAPKLILESSREVGYIRFCLSDPNILVGGCDNGQVIIWDIKNRIDKVEEIEILSTNQMTYRQFMDSLMNWMKKIHFKHIVKPTAVSNIEYSHKGPILKIIWTSPLFAITKLGTVVQLLNDKHSMQFYTASEDGSILLWDLQSKPAVSTTGFKAVTKLKRLKRRPSALMVDVSPYRILHLNLIPTYKLNIVTHNKRKIHPVSSMMMAKFPAILKKEEREITQNRMKYIRIYPESEYKMKQSLYASSLMGEFFHLQWIGQNFETGEILNNETIDLTYYSQFHDGPIFSTKKSSTLNLTLTVGGRIFALWDDNIKNRPLFWRKCEVQYMRGFWQSVNNYHLTVSRIDGCTENWLFSRNSRAPYRIRTFCSDSITYMRASSVMNNNKYMTGFGDNIGFFHVQTLPDYLVDKDPMELQATINLFEWEKNRKKEFWQWQTRWNERSEAVKTSDVTFDGELKAFTEVSVLDKPEGRASIRKSTDYSIEQIKLRQMEQEKLRIRNVILTKKQLNTKELEKRRKPIQELELEHEKKKSKQKEALRTADVKFQENVSTLFPKAIKKRVQSPEDPYKTKSVESWKKEQLFKDFKYLNEKYKNYVRENEYIYEYDLKQALKTCELREQHLFETSKRNKHWNRYTGIVKIDQSPRISYSRKIKFDDESKENIESDENLLTEETEEDVHIETSNI